MGPKLFYLAIFGLEFEKTTFIFKISTLEFTKNEFLTNIVIFAYGPVFLNVQGPPFLKIWIRVRVRSVKYVVRDKERCISKVIHGKEKRQTKIKLVVMKQISES